MKRLIWSLIMICAMGSIAVMARPKLPKRPGYAAASVSVRVEPDYTGREAMLVDGKRVGVLKRQRGGTYLLIYSNGDCVRCSINEVVLMPKGE